MSGATVLYDAPGPRGRLRNNIIAVVFTALVIALVAYVIVVLAGNDQLSSAKWKPFIEWDTWGTYILPGLWGTVKAAVLSIILALLFGFVLGIGRLSDHRWVRWVSGVVVEFFRAIPVLILIIFAYQIFAKYALFPSAQLAFAAVVVGLALYNGSVIAEIIRSGITSLPKGQTEAAHSLGLRKSQTMRIILLPQAVSVMMPALVSQMVTALKDSALGYVIGYSEVVRSGQNIASFYGNYLPALIVVAIVMICINFALSVLATRLEQRLRAGSGRRPKREVAVAADTPTL